VHEVCKYLIDIINKCLFWGVKTSLIQNKHEGIPVYITENVV